MLIRKFRGADGTAGTYSAPPTSAALPCGLELPAQSCGQFTNAALEANELAEQWLAALLDRGWQDAP